MTNSTTDLRETRAYHHGDLRAALVKAALAIVTEEQNWAFSLREVARRAGVSHNAPYNHFADKRELLAAVGAEGFERLGEAMRKAIAGHHDAAQALEASGIAYMRAGIANPALYRLVFGPTLGGTSERPAAMTAAGAKTRGVLEGIIERGARDGTFAIAPDDADGLRMAVLAAWSAVHGLTMLTIDGLADPPLPVEKLVEGLTEILLSGLRRQ